MNFMIAPIALAAIKPTDCSDPAAPTLTTAPRRNKDHGHQCPIAPNMGD